MTTGRDKVFFTRDKNLVEASRLLPVYRKDKGSDDCWMVNPWDEMPGSLVKLERYPRLKSYLEANKKTLSERHIVKIKKDFCWYRTIDEVHYPLLEHELLLLHDFNSKPFPDITKGLYPTHGYYWLFSDYWDMRVLAGLFMSRSVRSFVEAFGERMRYGPLRFQAQYLKLIHIPHLHAIRPKIRSELAEAFLRKDKEMADYSAELAYHEAMEKHSFDIF